MLLLDADDEPLLDEPVDPLPDELLESLAPVILIRKSWVALAVPSLAKIEKISDTVLPACIALIAAVLGL